METAMTSEQSDRKSQRNRRPSGERLTRRNALKRGLGLGAGLATGAFGIIGRASAAPVTLRFGSDSPIGAAHTKSALIMKEFLESRSQGRVQVTIYPDAQLGNNGVMANSIKAGTLDAVVTDVGHLSVAVPELDVFSLPFLYKDSEQVLRFAEGPVGERLKPKINEAFGCEVLGFTSQGPINMYNGRRPIRTPADITGLKMGSQATRIARNTILAFGGIPTVIGINALYTSLQTNLIDGASSSLPDMIDIKLYQVTKYLTLTSHYSLLNLLVVSKKFLDKLAPEDRDLVRVAAKPALDEQTAAVFDSLKPAVAFLQEKGIQVFQMEDPSAFTSKMDGVYKEAADSIGADIVEQARRFAAT
jgi:tripartite ATP-independent transporter DctP family solute receptor